MLLPNDVIRMIRQYGLYCEDVGYARAAYNMPLLDGSFDSFGYGDSRVVLMWPEDLVAELKDRDGEKYGPLIEELRSIPDGIYVSF